MSYVVENMYFCSFVLYNVLMLLSRRVLREKALHALYTYAQHRAVTLTCLEELSTHEEVLAVSEHADALYDLRTTVATYTLIDKDSSHQLLKAIKKKSAAYRSFYEKTLCQHQAQCERDASAALDTYEKEAQQLIYDYYLLLNVYMSLYRCSQAKGGRLAQSPVLASLVAKERGLATLLRKYKLPTEPPKEVLLACYALLRDNQGPQSITPTWEKDCQYLLVLSRGKWLKTPAFTTWMEEQDPCWLMHKPILQGILVKGFKNSQKYTTQHFVSEKKPINLAEELAFGRILCQAAIASYMHWSKELSTQALHWELERISLIDRTVLVLALSEMVQMSDVPLRVSMNEYIEIAKTYGGLQSGAFVNGLLVGVLKRLENKGQLPQKTKLLTF